MHRMMALAALCFLLLQGFWASAADVVPPEDKAKQEEFKKGIRNPEKVQRQNALGLLDNATHSSWWQLVAVAIGAETDKDLRIDAFTRLSKMPARDSRLAALLGSLFQQVKSNEKDEMEIRLGYARAMANSQFKAPLGDVLTEFIATRLRYPDLRLPVDPTGDNASAEARERAAENLRKKRAEFEDFLKAFNEAVPGSDIDTPTKNAPTNLKKEWLTLRAKVAAGDKKLLDKMLAEDKEKAKAEKEKK